MFLFIERLVILLTVAAVNTPHRQIMAGEGVTIHGKFHTQDRGSRSADQDGPVEG